MGSPPSAASAMSDDCPIGAWITVLLPPQSLQSAATSAWRSAPPWPAIAPAAALARSRCLNSRPRRAPRYCDRATGRLRLCDARPATRVTRSHEAQRPMTGSLVCRNLRGLEKNGCASELFAIGRLARINIAISCLLKGSPAAAPLHTVRLVSEMLCLICIRIY